MGKGEDGPLSQQELNGLPGRLCFLHVSTCLSCVYLWWLLGVWGLSPTCIAWGSQIRQIKTIAITQCSDGLFDL